MTAKQPDGSVETTLASTLAPSTDAEHLLVCSHFLGRTGSDDKRCRRSAARPGAAEPAPRIQFLNADTRALVARVRHHLKANAMKTPVSALLLAAAVFLPQAVQAEGRVSAPPVPDAIRVPAGYRPFLVAHAVGTQDYVCVATGTVYQWSTFGPQATLFSGEGQQVMTHFLGATPYSLLPAPTWQHSRDSSAVWGQVLMSSTDPAFVTPGAVPWLLLEAAVVGNGPTGGKGLLPTRFVQRVNTVGGKAPTSGCASPQDVAKRALVPYEADYYFFRQAAINDPKD